MEGYSNGYVTTPISYTPSFVPQDDQSRMEQLEAMVEELTLNALSDE